MVSVVIIRYLFGRLTEHKLDEGRCESELDTEFDVACSTAVGGGKDSLVIMIDKRSVAVIKMGGRHVSGGVIVLGSGEDRLVRRLNEVGGRRGLNAAVTDDSVAIDNADVFLARSRIGANGNRCRNGLIVSVSSSSAGSYRKRGSLRPDRSSYHNPILPGMT